MDWGAQGQGEQGAREEGQGDKEKRDKGTRRQGEERQEGGDWNKWVYARRVAAALGYIALVSGDRLTVVNLQRPRSEVRGPMSSVAQQFGPVRGRGHTLRLFEWLAGLRAVGTTDLNASSWAYGIAGRRAGLAVLISDLLSPAGYTEGLVQLAARGHEVAVIHVLSPDEVEPPLGGDLRLLDVETGDSQEVTIDGGMRTFYRRRLTAWRDEIRATCRARDVHYVPVETDTPFDRVVLYDLQRVGLVR
jgi:uncharacterized protein (DUF58 family)